ncbi:MAG: tetratricopeptide repeat protein [Muribaculaceae bacterium]|nr:tetratricopeptide repeat protein [Muribaculaceae bacterium]
MAKQNENETRTPIDDLNDSLSTIEQKVQNNQKIIVWASVTVAVVVCLILIYVYAIRRPGISAANDAIGQADMSLAIGNDSIALTQYQQVADNYGYDAGNRAALNAAIILYRDGKYEEALNYLKKYSATESIIGASSKSLEGDCYVNLQQYDKAIGCYRDAVKLSDDNPYYTPVFMMKEATVERELKNYEAEAKLYQQIADKYPNFGNGMNVNIEKYIKRAEAQAQSK